MKKQILILTIISIIGVFLLIGSNLCFADSSTAGKYVNSGLVKVKNGAYQKAIEDYTNAIKLEPKNAAFYAYRGKAKGLLGIYQEAIQDCNKAIEFEPDYADTYYYRGEAKEKLGLTKEAKDDYKYAEEILSI